MSFRMCVLHMSMCLWCEWLAFNAALYFLCHITSPNHSAHMQIPGIAPLTPITSILPLVFVITVTAIKQAYEDRWVASA